MDSSISHLFSSNKAITFTPGPEICNSSASPLMAPCSGDSLALSFSTTNRDFSEIHSSHGGANNPQWTYII